MNRRCQRDDSNRGAHVHLHGLRPSGAVERRLVLVGVACRAGRDRLLGVVPGAGAEGDGDAMTTLTKDQRRRGITVALEAAIACCGPLELADIYTVRLSAEDDPDNPESEGVWVVQSVLGEATIIRSATCTGMRFGEEGRQMIPPEWRGELRGEE